MKAQWQRFKRTAVPEDAVFHRMTAGPLEGLHGIGQISLRRSFALLLGGIFVQEQPEVTLSMRASHKVKVFGKASDAASLRLTRARRMRSGRWRHSRPNRNCS